MTRLSPGFGRGFRILLLPLLFLVILSLIPDRNPSGDTYGYAAALRRAGSPADWNPNHLFLLPFARLVHDRIAIPLAGESASPLTTLLVLSKLSYFLSGVSLLAVAKHLFPKGLTASVVACGYLSSHAILLFASDGEPILLGHLPLLLGALSHVAARRNCSISLHMLAGTLYGLSVLFMANNIWIVAPICIAALGGYARRRKFPDAALGGLPILVALGLALVLYSSLRPATSFLGWVTQYGGGSSHYSYGALSLLSLLRVVYGFGESLIAVRGAARVARSWTEGAGSVTPESGDLLILGLWALAVLAAALLTVASWARWRRHAEDERKIVVLLTACILLLLVFNLRWIGSDPQFWVPVLPPFWILWGFALREHTIRAWSVLATCVLAVLPVNLTHSVWPTRTDRSAIEERASLAGRLEERSLLITPGLDWVDGLGVYDPPERFEILSLWQLSTKAMWKNRPESYYAAVDSIASTALNRGRPVYLKGVIHEPFPQGVPWREMRPRGFKLEELQALFMRFECSPAFTLGGATYRTIRRRAPEDIEGSH